MGSSPSRPSDALADSVSPHHNALFGKVVIVTGPTNGIGYETARVLAKHGAHVVLAARNATRNQETKDKLTQEIKAELPAADPKFSLLQLDLASLASVRSAANEFLGWGLPLHILINNAGILTLNGQYAATVDGYESHVGSNHLGHFYFTRLLLPKLRATATAEAPAKIINVSSALHTPQLKSADEVGKSFVSAQDNYSDIQAYHRSKLYNIYHAQTLATSEGSSNVLAFALHPGVIATNISHSATGIKRLIFSLLAPALSTPNAGAATTLHCALRAGAADSGKYFDSSAVAKPKAIARDENLRAKLIEVSEKLVLEFEAKGE